MDFYYEPTNIKPTNPYLYQSKPFIDDYDLNWHDFDARMFDSQLGRWHVIDPVMQFASPYIGMGNNPVSLVDPQGTFVPYPDGDEVIINSIDDSGHNTEIDATLPFEIVISGSSGGYSVPTTGYWGYGSSGGGGLQNYSGNNSSGSGGVSHGGGGGYEGGGNSANSQPGAGNPNEYAGNNEPVPAPTTEELIAAEKEMIGEMSSLDGSESGDSWLVTAAASYMMVLQTDIVTPEITDGAWPKWAVHAVLGTISGVILYSAGEDFIDFMAAKGGKQRIDSEWTGVSAGTLREAWEAAVRSGDSQTKNKIDKERKRRGRKKGQNKSWD